MNKKKKFKILLIQLLLLVVAIVGILIYITTQQQQVQIYEFSRTIKFDNVNYAVTANDIKAVKVLAADVKSNNINDANSIIGKYIVGDVYVDTPVTTDQLSVDPPVTTTDVLKAEAAYKKITIPITYQTSFAGDLKSGDHVDLAFVNTDSGETTSRTTTMNKEAQTTSTQAVNTQTTSLKYTTAKIFLQDIAVYQVYAADGSVYVRKETDPTTLHQYNGELAQAGSTGTTEQQTNYAAPAYAVLSVTGPQYEEITARMYMGIVQLVGRFEGSQNNDTSGYIVAKNGDAVIYAGEGTLEENPQLISGTEAETQPGAQDVKKTGIYSFIQDLAKIQMTDEQREKYASIYTRYSSIMNKVYGAGWESDNPDAKSLNDITSAITPGDETTVALVNGFKTDLDSLAKELRGDAVTMP